MTIITVASLQGRLTIAERRKLAEVRAVVIRNILAAMADALHIAKPSSTSRVTFRVLDEGSWSSRGDVLSILDLLDTGVFTPNRIAAIRQAVR